MPADVLTELGLDAERTLCLSPRLRDRVVAFLLRWREHQALDACLTELLAQRPLLSLLDARAQMLLEQGQLDAAWETMRERHERSASIPSRILAARIRLVQGDRATAVEMAGTLTRESPESPMAWGFLGEVRLATGDEQAALAAYHRANDLAPDSRAYHLGMLAIYQARGDWVTASAYAARLQEQATAESPLPVLYLRRLREYFQASKERNRVADIDTELAARYASELADLRQAIAAELGRPLLRHAEPAEERERSAMDRLPEPAEALDSFAKVEVTLEEREHLRRAAQRLFGFPDLLPGQAEIMSCALRGEDVLAVLPTGAGKSLCYQLPALLSESGTTLVISPLIALMKDQVDKLSRQERELATTINSTLEGDELARRLKAVREGRYRLVYAAPERLRQPVFLFALQRAGINRLVVDEVHCVSIWGHDFRPDYLYIARARQALGNPPLLAMTATAAPRVRQDIQQRLGAMRIIAGEVMRPNLRLEVLHVHNEDEKLRYLLSFCGREPGAGIVYGGTRARCESLAELLRSQGISAVHYHAGLEDRAAVQDQFMGGQVRVAVATVAFGMGIDKPDIRFILHYVPPPSLEAYYQEAGRAGRDGLPSRCVLLYAPADRVTLTKRAQQDLLSKDFLRQVYAGVQKNLRGALLGRLVVDDLRRELQVEEIPIRVALSLLEQAGLLRRGPDLPRTVTLSLKRTPPGGDADLTIFCRTARLSPGQRVDCDPLQVAQATHWDAMELEQRLLGWADAGWLDCRLSARDPLVGLLPAPLDAERRVRALLEQYEQIQRQRVSEIVSYANTRHCRHGHVSSYLGGRVIRRCSSCDNCLPAEQVTPVTLPDPYTQLQTILQVAAHGWGQRNLVHILRGHRQAPEHTHNQAGFGALAFRSVTAIEQLVKVLLQAGFLSQRQLQHGGVMVELTPAGQRALKEPSPLRTLAAELAPAEPSAETTGTKARAVPTDAAALADNDPLLLRLRAWRLERAREEKVAAFIIAHDALLRNVAAARPQSEDELLAVKGMGPAKMEKYGTELLALVRGENRQVKAVEPQTKP